MKSEFLKLNKRDFFRGMLISIVAIILESAKFCIDAHGLNLTGADLKYIIATAISTLLSYLSINLFTNSRGKIQSE